MSRAGAKMAWRIVSLLGLLLGLVLTVWLVSAASLMGVVHSFAKVGWGAIAVVAVRAVMIAMNGVAWSRLLASLGSVSIPLFVLWRWVRGAIDVLLQVASIGGGLVAARMLTFWGVSGAIAIASVVADLFLQTVAQVLFALVGVSLLTRFIGQSAVLPGSVAGIAAAVIVLGGFYVVQRYGGARLIDRAFVALSARMNSRSETAEPGFQRAMDSIWKGRSSYAVAALLVHTSAWMLGTFEVWLALHFMQWPVTLEQAIILESLGASISSAAFFIPGGWGVQEGGYILIGQLLSVPVQLSLTLSLVKRIPDLALGVPGLLVWYALETRRLFSARFPAS
jgi:glycosyltransferase 2 family protein